jgi:phospho-N-acetylmuramoyl-pentapeptide-transferase
MLYHLFYPLASAFPVFNVFRYITFRTGCAILTALLLCFVLGKPLIRWLRVKQKEGQPIREDGPAQHLVTKKGIPTMGGALILFALVASTMLWADLTNPYIWIVLLLTLGFGAIGAYDDYLKLTHRSSKGLPGKMKLAIQVVLAATAAVSISMLNQPDLAYAVAIPFLKNTFLNLGYFYILWAVLVMVGASNAVNLTDGLDGLAIVPSMIAAICFCLIAYVVGNHVFANYLQIHFVPGSGELAILGGAFIGAGLGFLWFNAPPAMIFMGDTGSLAVGGMLGAYSLITKHELVLVIVGGLFVIEAISVILQVGYYKLYRRRIFLMAPIHHHFEKKGWAEPTIVIRFWIISTVLALIGLFTLKLR